MKTQITRDRVSRNSGSLQAISDAISTERARQATEELYALIGQRSPRSQAERENRAAALRYSYGYHD